MTNNLDEIEYLVGKCILRYQAIELLLKQIHLLKDVNFTSLGLKTKVKALEKLSLGDLSNEKNIEHILRKLLPTDSETSAEAHISFKVEFTELNPLKTLFDRLKPLVKRRNQLVHRLLTDEAFNSDSNMSALVTKLREDVNELSGILTETRGIYNILQTCHSTMYEYLNSSEFDRDFEAAQLSAE
jgi:hypothetical protein